MSLKEKPIKGNGETRYLRPILGKKQIMLNNFLGGIAWGIGTLVGFALFATVLGFILNIIDFNLILGDWLGGIIKESIRQVEPAKFR